VRFPAVAARAADTVRARLAPARQREGSPPDRAELWWLLLILVVGFFVGVATHYQRGVFQGRPYPENTFLFRPGAQFSDLSATLALSSDPSPYLYPSVGFTSNYPPFVHVLLRPLAALPNPLALQVFLIGVAGATVWLVASQLRDVTLPLRLLAAVLVGVINYPMLFMLDRANIEGLALLLVAGAAICASRRSWMWSAVLIGIAAAVKVYPGLYVLVLIGARRYREAAVAVVTAATLTAISLLAFSGGVMANARAFVKSTLAFETTHPGDNGVQHGSSIAGMLAAAARHWPEVSWIPSLRTPIVVGLLLVGVVAIISGRLALWQSFAVIGGLTILVPSVAFDYRLILLLIPVTLLLRSRGGRFRWPAIVLLGLLCVPKGLPVLFGEVAVGVVVNPVLLLVLVVGLSALALAQRPAGYEPASGAGPASDGAQARAEAATIQEARPVLGTVMADEAPSRRGTTGAQPDTGSAGVARVASQ